MSKTQTSPPLGPAAFSRLSGLSRKALRIYEETGLLVPLHVDPQNRYRTYGQDQLAQARIIQVLRAMDVPIESIKILLSSPDPVTELRDLWQQREKQHVQSQALAAYLTTLLSGEGASMAFEVSQRQVPGAFVATITAQVYQHEAPAFISGSIQKIRTHLHSIGVQPEEIDWTICHEGPSRDARGVMEVCVPYQGVASPTAEISLKFEPAHREAYIRLRKGQAGQPLDLMQAYHAGQQWLTQHDLQLVLGSREVYFADWSVVADHEEAFDLAFPFEVLPV
ncbi:MerR family transcriptional regulator [Deinococcus roseus]|uniref:MerR family transcriptional regulator n=1 Tax=Deinococcus roseus TaxID=392414 RepID=A0ABQ2DKL3_9DEIO|nr:MerR family transcriptional regulator [Deinococcus roseus]GGJ58517.1 MerR family transcriptional regulator [Deinococcus roseus]